MPVFNAGRHLDRCLASICSWDDADLEICVVDDGSTDSSPDLLEAWAGRDERIRVVSQPRQGVAGARNRLLEIAGGELLVLHDADDVSHRERLRLIAESFAEHRWDLFHSRSFLINERDEIRAATHLIRPFEPMLRRGHCTVIHGSVAIRRAALEGIGGYRDHSAEDLDLWIRLLDAGRRIHYERRPLYAKRIHARSVTAVSTGELLASARELSGDRGPVAVPADLAAYLRLRLAILSGEIGWPAAFAHHPLWMTRIGLVHGFGRSLARRHRRLAPGFDGLSWAA